MAQFSVGEMEPQPAVELDASLRSRGDDPSPTEGSAIPRFNNDGVVMVNELILDVTEAVQGCH